MHWQQSLCDQVVTVAEMQGSVSRSVRQKAHGSGNFFELQRHNDGKRRRRWSHGSKLLGDVIQPSAEKFGQASPKKPESKQSGGRGGGERARGPGVAREEPLRREGLTQAVACVQTWSAFKLWSTVQYGERGDDSGFREPL